MKQILTSIILILVISPSFSQALKKIVLKNKDQFIREEYFVLKQNHSIKEGEYNKFSYFGALKEKGYYKNNKKDSLWTIYNYDGSKISKIGYYKEGNPIGPWKIFNLNNEVAYIYDYSTDKLIEYNWYKTKNTFPVLLNNTWKEESIDNPPLIIGYEDIYQIVLENIRYPELAVEKGLSGKVYVSYVINEEGKMIDVKVKKGAYPELDQEALRVVRAVNVKWFPARKNGIPVTVEAVTPVIFKLQM